MTTVDVDELRDKVKDMYRSVAKDPNGEFHLEMGRALALRLGYDVGDLDAIPGEAIDSFAGVGCPLSAAGIAEGDHVVDLGSGSGTDVFVASRHAGATGEVVGVDMTDGQLAKSRDLADRDGFSTVRFVEGLIESAPVDDGWGRRGHQQRRGQPLRRQDGGVPRDCPNPATGWADVDFGHRV